MKTLLHMTSPITGERECYASDASPEEVHMCIDQVFSAAGYYDFVVETVE